MSSRLPDFIIIGAMKCGTTSLHHYLRNQSEIFMPLEKEIDFFSNEKNFKKGLDWYKKKFSKDFLLNGEASPNYSKAHIFGNVAERIYRVNPEVKLIYLYRDPVERALSHYVHSYSSGRERYNPDKALTEHSNYIMTSKYYWQVQHFLEFFDEEQLLFVNSETLRNDRERALKRITSFLEVKYDLSDEILKTEKQKSKSKTKRTKINYYLVNTSIGNYLKKVVPESLKVYYRNLTEKELTPPDFTQNLMERLNQYLKKDYKQFQELIKNK